MTTATVTPIATNTLTVPAGRLRWALGAVLPHVTPDDSLPVLRHVHVQATPGTPGRMILTATDRYTAVRAEVHVDTDLTFEGLIHADNLRDIGAFAARHSRVPMTLAVEGRRITVTPVFPGGLYEAPSRSYYVADPEFGLTFPKVRPIFSEALKRASDAATIVGLNLALTAKFRHAMPARHAAAVVKGSTGRNPMIVAYGLPGDPERFLGLQMPVSFAGTEATDPRKALEGWDL